MCVCIRVFNGVCLCVEMEVESKGKGGRECKQAQNKFE